jgi:hypothetical protein
LRLIGPGFERAGHQHAVATPDRRLRHPHRPRRHRHPRCRGDHPTPQRRQAPETRPRQRRRPPRAPADIGARRPILWRRWSGCHSRSRAGPGRNCVRLQGPPPLGAGLRPSGRRGPGSRRSPHRLHHARHTDHSGRRRGPSGGRERSAPSHLLCDRDGDGPTITQETQETGSVRPRRRIPFAAGASRGGGPIASDHGVHA